MWNGDHALVLAEGVPAETFVDNVQRAAFDNWAEHEQLYPAGASTSELPYPRAKSARQTPRRVHERLMTIALALYEEATAAA